MFHRFFCTFARARSLNAILGTSLLLSTLLACQPAKPEALSQLRHEAGEPVRDRSGWNWVSLSAEAYVSNLMQLLGFKAELLEDPSSPRTQRLQYWLDQIDTRLRQRFPDQLAAVPHPQARVIRMQESNALVAHVWTCIDNPIVWDESESGDVIDSVMIDAHSGRIALAPPSQLPCQAAGEAGPQLLREMAASFAAQAQSCQFLFGEDGTLHAQKGCEKSPELAGKKAAKRLYMLRTANYVTVFSGLIERMDEMEIVSILTHELGHFYRSHATAPIHRYNFFYKLNEEPSPHRPEADAAMKEIGGQAGMGSLVLQAREQLQQLPDQRLHPGLILAAGNVITNSCQTQNCEAPCQETTALMADTAFRTKLGTFPFGPLQEGSAASYPQFEALALQCLATLKLPVKEGAPSFPEDVTKAFKQPSWPEWVQQPEQAQRLHLNFVNSMIFDRVRQIPIKDQDYLKLFLAMSERLNAQDKNGEAALRKAFEAHLGHYTSEQEADELSLEWMAMLGIDPHVFDRAIFHIADNAKGGMKGINLGKEDCQVFQEQEWHHPDGTWAFVPIGPLTDPHHNFCYRIFNAEREMAAHHYQKEGDFLQLVPKDRTWEQLQEKTPPLIEAKP